MAGPGRSQTAAWAPSAPKTRPFRFGLDVDPDPDPPLGPGTVVGDRYRIVRLLGEGGMGRVYEAEHNYIHQRVALKLLRRDRQAESEHVARFEQEAYAASRIGDPAIVQVKDFGHLPDGRAYLAMELLEGESLEDWMSRPGRLDEALEWMAAVARGLGAAHDAGVVHRDIKPANIFLERTDRGDVRPRILDFGLAKVTTPEQGQIETQAGSLLGTPYYLAPERALGKPLDARTDLYSLGVILYELITGNVPFSDETFMGILGQHIKVHPLDPRQAAPDRAIPDDVAMLAMRLLAKDPARRPQGGAAVAAEIDEMLAQDRDALAAVPTGPRVGASPPTDDTVVLDEVAKRSTNPPVAGAGVDTHRMGSPTPPGAEPVEQGTTVVGHASVSQVAVPVVSTRVETAYDPAELARPRRPVGAWATAAVFLVAIAVAGWWAFGVPGADERKPSATPGVASPPPPESTLPRVAAPPARPDPGAAEAGPGAHDSSAQGSGDTESAPPQAAQRGGTTGGGKAAPKVRKRRRPARARKPRKPKDSGIPELKDDVYEEQ